jgi:uncharacterized membrane protein YkvA (DUF1232 family)
MTDVSYDDDSELDDHLRDAADDVPRDRAERFYDRLRASITRFLEKRGGAVGTAGEFLLLVPDVFILLWRLVNDARVSGRNKVLLGSSVAYYIFPIDMIPEAIVGPIGYMDDLVFGVYVLNKILGDTDIEVVREHWPGSSDVLDTIQNVLGAAESLVGRPVLDRIKKMVK